jgi:hypothetical protein
MKLYVQCLRSKLQLRLSDQSRNGRLDGGEMENLGNELAIGICLIRLKPFRFF